MDVLALKKDIRNHVVDKLRKCANKSNSRSFHTPHYSDFPAGIAKLRKAIRGKRCGVAAILFAAVSDQLCKRGELLTEEPGVFLPGGYGLEPGLRPGGDVEMVCGAGAVGSE